MVANTDIPKNILLCEYAGNFISLQEYHKKDLKNDSNMDLTITPFSETTICPYTHANLGRLFFSSVNNDDEKSINKINVFSVKILIDGSLHIFLIAFDKYKKGDIIYLNYNADEDNYPTSKFQ